MSISTWRPVRSSGCSRTGASAWRIGQPRYGTPDATYAVWNDGQVQIKHLHYDHDEPARKLLLASLSPEVIDQLCGILETGMA